jgi:hypothetical protein
MPRRSLIRGAVSGDVQSWLATGCRGCPAAPKCGGVRASLDRLPTAWIFGVRLSQDSKSAGCSDYAEPSSRFGIHRSPSASCRRALWSRNLESVNRGSRAITPGTGGSTPGSFAALAPDGPLSTNPHRGGCPDGLYATGRPAFFVVVQLRRVFFVMGFGNEQGCSVFVIPDGRCVHPSGDMCVGGGVVCPGKQDRRCRMGKCC